MPPQKPRHLGSQIEGGIHFAIDRLDCLALLGIAIICRPICHSATLSALDEKIRRGMQTELRNIQKTTGTTFIYVTHDQEEALTMSDRIVVLNRGRCIQCDAPERIFRRPRTRFVASFFRGCNVLEGRLDHRDGSLHLELSGTRVALPESFGKRKGPQAIAIRGEAVFLGKDARRGDIVFTARLTKITYRGVYSDYRLRLSDGQELSATLTQQQDLREGDDILVGVRADDIVVLDEDRNLSA